MRRARSDPIGHKTASHFSSTGIPGEPKRGSAGGLSPQPREGIDGLTEGGKRTLITCRLGSPEILVLLKCDAVLWPVGSLRARRLKKDPTPGRLTWKYIFQIPTCAAIYLPRLVCPALGLFLSVARPSARTVSDSKLGPITLQ